MIKKSLAILCVCIFALVACDQKEQHKKEIIPLKLNPPSAKYPEGSYDVNHNGTIYRIPSDTYLRHSSDMFNLGMLWPEFINAKGKLYRNNGAQQYFDTIQLHFARQKDIVAGGVPDNYRPPLAGKIYSLRLYRAL